MRRSRSLPHLNHEAILALVLVVLCIFLAVFVPRVFEAGNLVDILGTNAVLGILAAGLLVVLVSGELDVSFTAVMTLAQYVSSDFLIRHGGNWVSVFAMSVAIALALGLVNALLVHVLRASSVIVTIATLNVYFGLTILISHGQWLYEFPDWFFEGFSVPILPGPHGVPITLNLASIALLVVWSVTLVLLKFSVVGRRLYFVGDNREAAVRVGLSLLRTRLFAFGYLGVVAGIAAVVHAQLVQTVAPNALVGTELEVLAAVVLGGASLTGGVGSFNGMVLGVCFVALMKNGLTLAGISSYQHRFLLGLVIVASVTLSGWRARKTQEAAS